MATAELTRKIWAAAREISVEREQVYDLVEGISGGRSVSSLSTAHAAQVIDRLVELGARGPSKPHGRQTAPNEVLMITADQRALIDDLRSKLGGKWGEDRYFAGACERVIKRARPVTASQGVRVIEMLKARLSHEESRRGA